MNWGNSIILAFVLFAIFILYMVVQAFNQNVDLVAENYYALEINYQKKLEQKSNLAKLSQRVKVDLEPSSIILTFPKNQTPVGEIHFYHPARKIFDYKITIATDTLNKQFINKEALVVGNYRINISWESDGKEYFQQEKISIQ